MAKAPSMQPIIVAAMMLAIALKQPRKIVLRVASKRGKGGPKTALPCRSDKCRRRLLFDGDDDAGTDGAAAFT
ncbi:hypothetical protein, partial [Mesorhizobium sp.]|uniref:hypothetical protein n=1 Tax=Mesorhizobium sp. TaxID=1871066 RepID=UPI0025CDBD39